MTTLDIALVVGSLRKASLNRKLAHALVALAPASLRFHEVRIDDLPLYNQEEDGTPVEAVQRLRDEIRAADGVLFVSPEYNRSIPGPLKNAIDHGSRPYGKSVWKLKPAGVIGIAGSAVGTAAMQQHLRPVLAYLDMPTLGQPEAFLDASRVPFDADGTVSEETARNFLQTWVGIYAEWVRAHTHELVAA